jgi:hypothetical protein
MDAFAFLNITREEPAIELTEGTLTQSIGELAAGTTVRVWHDDRTNQTYIESTSKSYSVDDADLKLVIGD